MSITRLQGTSLLDFFVYLSDLLTSTAIFKTGQFANLYYCLLAFKKGVKRRDNSSQQLENLRLWEGKTMQEALVQLRTSGLCCSQDVVPLIQLYGTRHFRDMYVISIVYFSSASSH